jgi:hypothetical protein
MWARLQQDMKVTAGINTGISSGSSAKASKRQGSAGAAGAAKWGAGVNPGADSGCRGKFISVIIFMPPPYAISTNGVN